MKITRNAVLAVFASGVLCCAQTKPIYVIGPLDVLSIKAQNPANLSGTVNVGTDGMIALPVIGEIKAAGSTQKQLEDAITERLKEVANNPDVSVQVVRVKSKPIPSWR